MNLIRIYLTFILFIASCTFGSAQQIRNVSQYYTHTYKAEEHLIHNEMKNAAREYDSAFQYCSVPFSADLYNQIVVRLALGNYDEVKRLCEKLIVKGAELSFFNKSVFNEFRKTAYWQDLKTVYPSLAAERHFDTGLIKQIQSMIVMDQSVHCQLPQHSGDTVFVAQMSELNDTLSQSLSDLLLKHNYLDEETIGTFFIDTNMGTQPFYWVLVLHEFQRHGVQLDSQLKQMIVMGKIKSETALSTMEMASSGVIFTGDFAMYKNRLYQFDLGDTNSKIFKLNAKYVKRLLTLVYNPDIIKMREEYYMDKPENITAKIKFINCNKAAPFLFPVAINVIGNFKTASDEMDFYKQYKRIDCEFIGVK
ncbi:MAG: hypothetical protein WC716_14145 [Chitinophagaceae bacterium]|jgi:hypothetical protein